MTLAAVWGVGAGQLCCTTLWDATLNLVVGGGLQGGRAELGGPALDLSVASKTWAGVLSTGGEYDKERDS